MTVFIQFFFGLLLSGLMATTIALIVLRLLNEQNTERRRFLREEFRQKLRAALLELAKPDNNGITYVTKTIQPKGKETMEAFKNAVIDVYAESNESRRENLVTIYEVSGMLADDVRAIYNGPLTAKSRAIFRIGRLRCNGAIEALTTATRNNSTGLRLVAIWSLTEIGDTRAMIFENQFHAA